MTATALAHALNVRSPVAWLRRFVRTTPGIVVLLAVGIAALCALTGVVATAQLDRRIAHHSHLLERSEPVTYAAQNLYAELSAADAAAASAFLSGGIQTPATREHYQQSLAGAAAALADATAGTADVATRTTVAEITQQLATYAGLVESARANNVQGFPIGSAYLREASALMQTQLLPGAEKIYTVDFAVMQKDQSGLESVPVGTMVLLGLCLAAILAGSVIMARRTNRQFNVGLVVAAVLMLAALGWVVVATRVAAGEVERARADGTARFGQLAQARILASQARTAETMQLIAHGDPTAHEKEFAKRTAELEKMLAAGPATAASGLREWGESHRTQVDAYLGGDYPLAVSQAIGADPDASAAQYTAVESSLRGEIERTRTAVRDHIAEAGAALSWSPTGVLVLTIAAATSAVAGLWPRLKEFL